MGWLVELEISHLRFAIGGEHYYGSMRAKSKTVNGTLHGGYNPEKLGEHPVHNRKIDVKRPLTSQKEVTHLNKKDNNGYPDFIQYWAIGDPTNRFNSPDDIPEHAIRMFNEMFDPEEDILVYSKDKYEEPYKALAGSKVNVETLNELDREKQREWIWCMGFEGT